MFKSPSPLLTSFFLTSVFIGIQNLFLTTVHEASVQAGYSGPSDPMGPGRGYRIQCKSATKIVWFVPIQRKIMRNISYIIIIIVLCASLVVVPFTFYRGNSIPILPEDFPLQYNGTSPNDYQLKVLASDHAIVGMRPDAGDDYDIEVYTDINFTTMIDESSSVDDSVEFVALEKGIWASPPDRGVRVTSGTTNYVIEMENEVESHSIPDTWSGAMDPTPGNPVIRPGPPGAWDEKRVCRPWILYDGETYRMWYVGLSKYGPPKIGYATSVNGIIWSKHPGNPVLDNGPVNSWDSESVAGHSVYYDGVSYQMWYTGYGGSPFEDRIGHATSLDGISWTKNPVNPVLEGGPDSYDLHGVGAPTVIYDGLTYHMWYCGQYDKQQICYATSPNGITWTKYPGNPVLNVGDPGLWDDESIIGATVLQSGATYQAWYTAYSDSGSYNYRIGYATSPDGIVWTKHPDPVLDWGAPGSWEDYSVGAPSILYDGTTYSMWYVGDHIFGFENESIGYATSPDGITWTRYEGDPEVLDAYEVTSITAGLSYTLDLVVPHTTDLDFFIFNTTGGRDDALASSTNEGAGIDEFIMFMAPSTGDYLVVITNEDGGYGNYTVSISLEKPLPPTPYLWAVNGDADIYLNWTEPEFVNIDHYLIYRAENQTGFNFTTPWKDTSIDENPLSGYIDRLRCEWLDENVNIIGNDNHSREYYYTLRTVNSLGAVSVTSRTVGKWTKEFPVGTSAFSLPLEPCENITIHNITADMGADYIRWMEPITKNWMKHDGAQHINDTEMRVGEGYEANFLTPTHFTFTGMPGAMIRYDNTSFTGFDFNSNAKDLTVSVNQNGDVTLNWSRPDGMNVGVDRYWIYSSNTRDGFWSTRGVDYHILGGPLPVGTETKTHTGAASAGIQLYYVVVPESSGGVRGSSTYSIGVWTASYDQGYNTMGLPLKLESNHCIDWYCDEIENTWGMNYYNVPEQRWMWHKSIMPEGIYDTNVVMCEGYQISTSFPTKYTYIGV